MTPARRRRPAPRIAAHTVLSRAFAPVLAAAALLLAACGGDSAPPSVITPSPTPSAAAADDFSIGRPQNRATIGDVDGAFARYEATRSELIALFRAQPWFQDGLTRDESLFIERSLTFVARISGPRTAYVSEETIERKLYVYERVPVANGAVELLLIYEPGQDVEDEMAILTRVVPVLEALVGVEYPERVMTVINGAFEINDFNDGQFIRIARCCTASPFVLAHELAHTYWSAGPSWHNEGMADIYALLALERLNEAPPPGWRSVRADLDAYHESRRSSVDSGRFPDLTLPRRLASDGLYEVADVFLLDIRALIGAGAFQAAARDIYVASDFGRFILREKRIEDIYLARAEPETRDAVMALFNRVVWGDDGERYRALQEFEAP